MPKDTSFLRIRRGIFEHLAAGKMSLTEFGVYSVIHKQANYETGIAITCALRIHVEAPKGITIRQIQKALNSLESDRYIRRFRVRGKHGNYAIFIDKYELSRGLKTYRLNAWESNDCVHPKYEECTEVGTDLCTEPCTEVCTELAPKDFKEIEIEIEKDLKPKTVRRKKSDGNPESNSLFMAFYQKYPRATHREAAYRAWCKLSEEYHAMAIASLDKWIRCPDWRDPSRRQFIPHPASWLNGKLFLEEPEMLEVNGNGKPKSDREQDIRSAIAESRRRLSGSLAGNTS